MPSIRRDEAGRERCAHAKKASEENACARAAKSPPTVGARAVGQRLGAARRGHRGPPSRKLTYARAMTIRRRRPNNDSARPPSKSRSRRDVGGALTENAHDQTIRHADARRNRHRTTVTTNRWTTVVSTLFLYICGVRVVSPSVGTSPPTMEQ